MIPHESNHCAEEDFEEYRQNDCDEEPKQKHLKPIIIFALNTGCRKEEILSLKWKQVDLKHGFINLDKTKNGEKRHIPINEPLNKLLTGLKEKNPEDCEWVFIDEKSKKRLIDVSHSFITAKKRAGIEDFHVHDLRHTFASHLVMKGVDITTVSRLLGHKSLSMTLRYAHLAPKHYSNAVNMLNDIMREKVQN